MSPTGRFGAPPDPYRGILAGPVDGPARVRTVYPEVEAFPGLVVEHRHSRVRGRIVRLDRDAAVVRTELGTDRILRVTPGAFSVDGQPSTLIRPRATVPSHPPRTASGSRSSASSRARVARTSRIWVEGVHDAELVEKVWGDDLRAEAIVVERLDGIDELADAVHSFGPAPGARLGILVDHLIPGSKESRLAAAVADPHVLVTGTPFVDVWQAVRPKVLGIDRWPVVPRGVPWKQGVCAAFTISDPSQMWKRLLASVQTYADLEPDLVGAVERLVDFVTDPSGS